MTQEPPCLSAAGIRCLKLIVTRWVSQMRPKRDGLKFPVARAEGIVVYCARLRKKDMNSTFKFAWLYYFGFTAGAARAC